MIRQGFWEERGIFLCCLIVGYSWNRCFFSGWKSILFFQESTERATGDSGWMGSSQYATGYGEEKSKKMKYIVADHLVKVITAASATFKLAIYYY